MFTITVAPRCTLAQVLRVGASDTKLLLVILELVPGLSHVEADLLVRHNPTVHFGDKNAHTVCYQLTLKGLQQPLLLLSAVRRFGDRRIPG